MRMMSGLLGCHSDSSFVFQTSRNSKALASLKSTSAPRIQELEKVLQARYCCLKEVSVIPTGSSDEEFQLQELGEAGASYFDGLLDLLHAQRPNRRVKVALSGGNTMYKVVQALEEKERNIEIYPAALVGRGPFIPEHIDPMVLISVLPNKSGRHKESAFYVTIQPFDRDRPPTSIVEDNETLKRTPKMSQVWEGMQKVDPPRDATRA